MSSCVVKACDTFFVSKSSFTLAKMAPQTVAKLNLAPLLWRINHADSCQVILELLELRIKSFTCIYDCMNNKNCFLWFSKVDAHFRND